MSDRSQLIQEQISYYRARAPEYDDWWFRRGRYDRGAEQRRAWTAEIADLERALDEAQPAGAALELACGTGIWTERLARRASSVVAIDAAPEVRPHARFDFVFFAFWMSHVPPDRFDTFWKNVEASLTPGGTVFFIDSLRAEDSTASDHVLATAGDPMTSRKLDDGREFRIFKVFYEPAPLQHRLEQAGWRGQIQSTGTYFIYGCVRRS